MRFSNTQQGMSIMGWIVVLLVVGFFATITFKVVPHFIDNKALQKVIVAVETDSSTAGRVKSVAEFYAHINKGLQVNNIRDLRAEDAIDIRQDGGEFVVHMKYEKREPVLKNIDLVVNFDKEYRVRAR